MKSLHRLFAVAICVCLLALARPASAYSLLTHEQLIDLTWQSSIVPLLLSRYPTLTPAQIEHARAYAYGGCVIQDIGYYPYGNVFFSDLTHYVRSGDFIINLFRNAGNADELAFAVGALSHYIGDNIGHSEATNLSVPIEFPKLADKYGRVVNYAQGKHQHVQTEFAFDIDEIAHHRFAPLDYLRHVGLEVPTKQLSLAFYQTYGLREDFTSTRHQRINIGAYRFAVHGFIPRIAYAVTILHRRHEVADIDNADLQKLTSEITAVAQQNDWHAYHKNSGIGTYALAGLIYIVPKIGPFKLLDVKGPTQQTEAEYVQSVVASSDELKRALRRFTPPPATVSTAALAAAADTASDPSPSETPLPTRRHGTLVIPSESTNPRHPLPNRDLDTGFQTLPAGYPLTDNTYATLLHRITLTPAVPVPPGIKEDILTFYANLALPFATKADPGSWATVQKDLLTLDAMTTSNAPLPYPTYGDGDDSTDAIDTIASPESGKFLVPQSALPFNPDLKTSTPPPATTTPHSTGHQNLP